MTNTGKQASHGNPTDVQWRLASGHIKRLNMSILKENRQNGHR